MEFELNLSVENRPSCCLPRAFVNLNSRTCRPLQPLINETDTHQSVGLLQFSAHMQQTRINFLISTASLTTSSTYSAIVHSCSVQSCSFSHRTSENEYLLDNWRKFLQTMKGRWCVCVCVIQAILDRTGYSLDVTTGQRKYGGPPPGLPSVSPGPGHEVTLIDVCLLCVLWYNLLHQQN